MGLVSVNSCANPRRPAVHPKRHMRHIELHNRTYLSIGTISLRCVHDPFLPDNIITPLSILAIAIAYGIYVGGYNRSL